MAGFTSLIKSLGQVTIRVRSVTNQLFLYGVILVIIGIASSLTPIHPIVTYGICILGGLMLVMGIGFYWYFCLKNPDYLRSESFQLRKQSIQLLGDDRLMLNPHAEDIVSLANPHGPNVGSRGLNKPPGG